MSIVLQFILIFQLIKCHQVFFVHIFLSQSFILQLVFISQLVKCLQVFVVLSSSFIITIIFIIFAIINSLLRLYVFMFYPPECAS